MNTDPLTVSQAARELGIKRPAMLNAIRRGRLQADRVPTPTTRTGFYYLIPRDEIERYRSERGKQGQGAR